MRRWRPGAITDKVLLTIQQVSIWLHGGGVSEVQRFSAPEGSAGATAGAPTHSLLASRFAKYYKMENGSEYRTLLKAFGIRFDVLVYGNVSPWVRRFSRVRFCCQPALRSFVSHNSRPLTGPCGRGTCQPQEPFVESLKWGPV